MKRIAIGVCVAVVGWIALLPGRVEARNPHCAGGIQYLIQALADKEKGNTSDYQREITKSIQQLEMCEAEDAKDFEAVGYLGWAYAEVDSAGPAGRAFARAIAGLTAKGDKKKVVVVETNRDHYWSIAFNEGISKVNTAQAAYPDYCKAPSGPEEEKLREEAKQQYDAAVLNLTRASFYRPDDPRTLRNLGAVHGFRCEFEQAEAYLEKAKRLAPEDPEVAEALRATQVNRANTLVEAKRYGEAIELYERQLQGDPANGTYLMGLADAYFRQAQTWSPNSLPAARADALKGIAPSDQELQRLKGAVSDSLRKADFKHAGNAYARASAARPDNPDLPFNAALAFQNAGEAALAEKQWRAADKLRPNDADILSSLASVLADQRKFDEAIKVLHQAVVDSPKNKTLHRQLGAVYTKAGNNGKGTEELMVYLALQNGQPVADVAAQTKKAAATSAAGKALAAQGPPEEVYLWEADQEKYETWFYWTKKAAHHFKGGTLVVKSDWSAPDLKTAAGSAR